MRGMHLQKIAMGRTIMKNKILFVGLIVAFGLSVHLSARAK